MAKAGAYEWVEVESYMPDRTSGLHGKVHIRPVAGGKFSPDLHVECSKLTDREGGGEFLYSYWGWDYEVVSRPDVR